MKSTVLPSIVVQYCNVVLIFGGRGDDERSCRRRKCCCFGVPSAECIYRRPTGTLVAIVCVFVPGKILVLLLRAKMATMLPTSDPNRKGGLQRASFITQRCRRINHYCTKWIYSNCESSLLRKNTKPRG